MKLSRCHKSDEEVKFYLFCIEMKQFVMKEEKKIERKRREWKGQVKANGSIHVYFSELLGISQSSSIPLFSLYFFPHLEISGLVSSHIRRKRRM